jgi:hypothetical protein
MSSSNCIITHHPLQGAFTLRPHQAEEPKLGILRSRTYNMSLTDLIAYTVKTW